ncbi:MAG: hypothetical protein HKP55_06350 [Gammaproteobacteria bacterium]|nr:hypothetical protein [Gammaproteobacteria bacterium]NNJ91276.1 hypothetical protein [Gammaproteobacteria bacterium]
MKTALIMLLALFSIQAQALDFLFEVPVKLDLIPKGIPQAKIECEVYSKIDGNQLIATGYSIRAIRSNRGELDENVEVRASYLTDWRDSAAGSYQCRLLLLTPWAKPSWQSPSSDSGLIDIQPRDNTEAIITVTGVIH